MRITLTLLTVLALTFTWCACQPVTSSPIIVSNEPLDIEEETSDIEEDQITNEPPQPKPLHDETDNEIEDEQEEQHHHHLQPSEGEFWEAVALALFLALCGAFCSGLGVGLLSISKLELKMMKGLRNENDKRMATKILQVVENHHLFLVTLLIANAIALESLPLVIHQLMPDWLAIITSTVLVLVVAQIIPQAFCTGPHKIKIASTAAPVIKILIKVFYPLAYPTAKLLDYLVGAEHDQRIQHKDFATFLNEDKFLNKTQKLLLTSTLDLRGTKVHEVMIDSNKFFMVQEKEMIGEQKVRQIVDKDYSYILVFKQRRSNVTGIIKMKQFAIKYLKSESNEMRASEVMKENSNMLTVYQDTNLLEMLMLFQAKSTRVALVCNQKRKVDPNIKSIMYTKTDMIYKGEEVQVTGIIFLYQLFKEMAEIKDRAQKKENHIISHAESYQPNREIEMNELNKPLMGE